MKELIFFLRSDEVPGSYLDQGLGHSKFLRVSCRILQNNARTVYKLRQERKLPHYQKISIFGHSICFEHKLPQQLTQCCQALRM